MVDVPFFELDSGIHVEHLTLVSRGCRRAGIRAFDGKLNFGARTGPGNHSA